MPSSYKNGKGFCFNSTLSETKLFIAVYAVEYVVTGGRIKGNNPTCSKVILVSIKKDLIPDQDGILWFGFIALTIKRFVTVLVVSVLSLTVNCQYHQSDIFGLLGILFGML